MKAQKACRYFIFPELVGYTTAWKYQRALAQHMHLQREEGQYIPDFLLLLQHPSVYTLGKGGLIENIKETNRTSMSDIYRVERGGDITWHGPGQLVSYPIIDLKHNHKKDLHWYMRQLEETVIVCLNKLNIKSIRLPEVNSGVWIDNNKISAVGVTASRWITNHGSAINIHCDLESFQCIIPCGIRDTTYGVCRLVDILQQKSTDKQNESYDSLFNRVQKLYIESLQEVFQYDHMSLGNNNELDDILGQYPEIQAAELHAIHR